MTLLYFQPVFGRHNIRPPSLCSQSEGNEHVANMTNALGHDFVGFLAVFSRHNIRPPSLCEQSELQCCASDLRRIFARCPLQRRNRHAIWLKTVLIGTSTLAAEICAGPHNRLLRRQRKVLPPPLPPIKQNVPPRMVACAKGSATNRAGRFVSAMFHPHFTRTFMSPKR